MAQVSNAHLQQKDRRKVSKEAAGSVKRCSLVRVSTLNIGTMTKRGRELADMMEQRNVDILCLQETKWKGSKARKPEVDANYFTMKLMEEKMGYGYCLKVSWR